MILKFRDSHAWITSLVMSAMLLRKGMGTPYTTYQPTQSRSLSIAPSSDPTVTFRPYCSLLPFLLNRHSNRPPLLARAHKPMISIPPGQRSGTFGTPQFAPLPSQT